MKIVVTGAAGAIGSHVAEALCDCGHKVFAIDAITDYYNPKIKEITIKDLTERGISFSRKNLVGMTHKDLPEDTDIIFHFAAQPGISPKTSFKDYVSNNIVATHDLLEAARQLKELKGFIHASTSSVYGRQANGDETSEPRPISYYGVTKLAAEQLALAYHREHKLPVIVLRLFSVYGERERPEKLYHKLIRAIERDEEFPVFEGSDKHVRSYTYVGDAIDGCLKALEHIKKYPGEIFNIGNDKTHTTAEGIKFIESLMKKKARLKKLPARPGDQKETAANIKKARNLLGYKPKTSLKDGLAAQVKWYRKKLHGKI
jgi:UDP-glucuronate 4-epimerase